MLEAAPQFSSHPCLLSNSSHPAPGYGTCKCAIIVHNWDLFSILGSFIIPSCEQIRTTNTVCVVVQVLVFLTKPTALFWICCQALGWPIRIAPTIKQILTPSSTSSNRGAVFGVGEAAKRLVLAGNPRHGHDCMGSPRVLEKSS